MEATLAETCISAKENKIAVLLPMEWQTELGWHNLVQVISSEGEILGCQAKNQFPAGEEKYYVPDGKRRIFTIGDLTFGIAICHEGWRYPETVRWAAVRGAQVVFHPHFAGSNQKGEPIKEWGLPSSPYYEKAMIARSVENSIYFASVNCAFKYPHAATSIISPWGELVAHAPYGEEHLLIEELDLSEATGYFAKRYKPNLYPD
jgi:predicted amidohydrolase